MFKYSFNTNNLFLNLWQLTTQQLSAVTIKPNRNWVQLFIKKISVESCGYIVGIIIIMKIKTKLNLKNMYLYNIYWLKKS